MPPRADDLITALGLAPHPEGGAYAETYRPPGDPASLIYFLLRAGERSRWHRLGRDELWLFHGGDPLVLHQIAPDGEHRREVLGLNLDAGARPQRLVPAGHCQSAMPLPDGHYGWTLVACLVVPAFDFADFTLLDDAEVARLHPER